MQITDVRIKLMEDGQDRLRAFCSLTIDGCFVVRDLKIIHGAKGPFVAMPSRKLSDRCPQCAAKNCLRALYCSQCGRRLPESRAPRDSQGRPRMYADIAHPINVQCREMIQQRVLASYAEEQVLAQQPGYACRYDEYGDDLDDSFAHEWDDRGAVRPTGEARHTEPAQASPPAPHIDPAATTRPAGDESSSRTDVGAREEFGAGIL